MSELLQRLGFGEAPSIVIIAAHPDDETIGAGAQLRRWNNVSFVHVTDGAPRDLADAHAAGFAHRSDYAMARRKEFLSALQLAGKSDCDTVELGFVDREAAFHLVELTQALAKCLRRIQPQLVLTHPYEGGHPDHDSTAFCVHAACQSLRKWHGYAPEILEMTSYHSRDGKFVSGKFLPSNQREIVQLKLTAEQCAFKRRLFDCFATQDKVLSLFEIGHECFRLAPTYDFTKPPHPGALCYESLGWDITGERWRTLAREVIGAMRPQLKSTVECLSPS
jgi:LmbE family N-acetylglucosaminyl deacetylase